jgi:hypothetical protein
MADTDAAGVHDFAYDVITRQLSFLIGDGVPIAQVMARVVPAYLAPPPLCPVCGEQWSVRSSRGANQERTLYYRTMQHCQCKPNPVILVSADFVKKRKAKRL